MDASAPIRWKRFYPSGVRGEFELTRYTTPAYTIVAVATWTPDHGYVGDYTACEECGCVVEAGGHHRDGCSHAPAHRKICSWCQDHPPPLPAERIT